jgi:hypothetical protein
MQSTRAKPLPALLTAAAFSLGVLTIALATAYAPSASASPAVAKPHGQASLSGLKKELTGLTRRIAALEHDGAKLKAGARPIGLAGGSLAGSYPKPTISAGAVDRPQLANDAVASAQIANGSVFSQDIADGAVGPSKLAPNSVGSPALIDGSVGSADLASGSIDESKLGLQAVGGGNLIDGSVGRQQLMKGAVTADRLAATFPITGGQGDVINPGQTKAVTITCPQGNRILSGGFEWTATTHDGASVISSGPAFNGDPNTQWAVQARVDAGGQANTLIVEALCISG